MLSGDPHSAKGRSPVKQQKKGLKARHAERAARFNRLLKTNVRIPAAVFNYYNLPNIFFEGQIVARDNDPKNRNCMVVKFPDFKNRYFFPLKDLEEWVEKYSNVPDEYLRDFATWEPEAEEGFFEGEDMDVANPKQTLRDQADAHPSSYLPKRKRKRADSQDPGGLPYPAGTSSRSHQGAGTATTTGGTYGTATGGGGGAAAAAAGGGRSQRHPGHYAADGGRKLMIQDVRNPNSYAAADLVGREVAVPAPLLHKRGNRMYRGRVMAVHLTIPSDLLIMLYEDPSGVFQLGAREVLGVLLPEDEPPLLYGGSGAIISDDGGGGYGGGGYGSGRQAPPSSAGADEDMAAARRAAAGAGGGGRAGREGRPQLSGAEQEAAAALADLSHSVEVGKGDEEGGVSDCNDGQAAAKRHRQAQQQQEQQGGQQQEHQQAAGGGGEEGGAAADADTGGQLSPRARGLIKAEDAGFGSNLHLAGSSSGELASRGAPGAAAAAGAPGTAVAGPSAAAERGAAGRGVSPAAAAAAGGAAGGEAGASEPALAADAGALASLPAAAAAAEEEDDDGPGTDGLIHGASPAARDYGLVNGRDEGLMDFREEWRI